MIKGKKDWTALSVLGINFECLIWFVILFYGILFLFRLLLDYFLFKRKSEKLKKMFLTQVQKRNGRIIQQGIFSHPRLMIPYQGMDVMIYLFPGYLRKPPFSRIETKLSTVINFTLEIFKEDFWSYLVKSLGLKDLQTHNPAFDKAFLIKANNESLARDFLTTELQDFLINRKLNHLRLEIKNQLFRFFTKDSPNNEEQLEELIETGLAFLNQVKQKLLS